MPRPSPIGRQPRSPARRQIAQAASVPAPIGGINAVDAATAMPITDAFDLVNMVGGRAGLTSRLGFAEWCIGMGGGPIRSVLSFAGSTSDKDRLFACSATDIHDVTTSDATPASVHTFAATSTDAGWGVGTTYVTSAGHFYLYADEENGLLLYTESTDAWTVVASGTGAGEISGVDPANVAFVASWKNRILLVEKGTGNLWYLPVGQIAGVASVLRLGNRFQHGGSLVGVWSWTIDGGSGVDDFLVAISSAGDVLVYQGTDPATAGAFELVGSWFVGAVPKGRRIATDTGGELQILSLLGLIPMSRLRSGTAGPDIYTTRKIQSLFNSYASTRRDLDGWSLALSPEDNVLLVNMPLVGNTYEQFAMSLATQGWAKFREVPALSMAVWHGKLYFGTYDGRLCVATGDLDDVKLDGATTYDEIDWSGLTSFQTLGRPGRTQLQTIRPHIWTQGTTPGFEVAARYDFDTTALSVSPADPVAANAAVWGAAVWGVSRWPGRDTECGQIRGATGSGTHVAIAFRGRSNSKATLMGIDVTWTNGGMF